MTKYGNRNRLEVHRHSFVSGERHGDLTHSHERGSLPHQHPNTGPATRTIDKDDWYRATGLRGGGRKKFTAKPSGEQLGWEELEDWRKSFEVIICPPMPDSRFSGPGVAPVARMVLGYGMKFEVKSKNGV